MIVVRVLHVEAIPGSVWTAGGITDDHALVRFAGDWRAMRDIAEALEQADEVVRVVLEPWQILEKLDNQTRTSPE